MGRGLLNLPTLLLTLRLKQPTLYAALRISINLKLPEVLEKMAIRRRMSTA